MPAVSLSAPLRSFGQQPDDKGFMLLCDAIKADQTGIEHMALAGLSWFSIISLLWTYGPIIVKVAKDVIAALQAPGGLTLAAITALVAKYGETVRAMIAAILAAMGLNMPT